MNLDMESRMHMAEKETGALFKMKKGKFFRDQKIWFQIERLMCYFYSGVQYPYLNTKN